MTTTCSACGHENREGHKFCVQCGASLAVACPTCGAPAEPEGRFCGHCGASLTPTAPPASPSPETLAVSGEKKHITVLFADVAGSMDLQERLDAEVWAQIMSRFVGILAEGIRKYGGTVDKFTGDGIMALFGAPVAQEDHARRACHAAWHLTKAIGEYSEELYRAQGVELHVRLGLNSGEVVVGRVGEDMRLDPTALGHTVGLAQRMEAMAEPGKAFLTERSAALVDGWFGLEDLGPRSVKGSTEPLGVYALGPPMSRPARRAVGASPLVGRERELALLEDALALATEGQFQVVGVVGEAGVGKSRLCEEFSATCRGRGITVGRAAGVSHARDVPLLPILSFEREYFGITDADDAGTARRKVTERLLRLDPHLEDVLPMMFDFLEVADPEHPVSPMAPDVRMRRIFDAIRRITARRSERETLVLVFEDLHWFDAQSETFLERLIESYPGSRTLVVANFRPEFSAHWMRHSYYRQLPLAPLRERAVAELLGGLLGMDLSLAPLVSFILERTGGNPFFVEEMIRALIEDGVLTGGPGQYRLTRPLEEIRVPPSVQAILAARIDRLPAEHKAILETASVIGRTFDTAVLSRVAGSSPHGLQETLSALSAAELLQESGQNDGPGGRYRFWHPLTQEVAYSSLLSEHRQAIHGAVADAITVIDHDRHDERAAVIASHLERAGRPLDAARWSLRAAAWSLRNDLGEAKRRWRAAIDFTDSAEASEASLEIGILARARLLQFGARTGIDPGDADLLYRQARDRADRLNNPKLTAMALAMVSSTRAWVDDLPGALAGYLEAARLAEQTDDIELQATISAGPPLPLMYMGPLTEGMQWADRVLTACGDDPNRGVKYLGYSALSRILNWRSRLLAHMGRLDEAARNNERAVALARSRGESEMLSWSLAFLSDLEWLSGEERNGAAAALEAANLGEETGNIACQVLGLESVAVAAVTTAPDDAVIACQRALAIARQSRSGLFQEASVLAHLARAYLATGDERQAIMVADEAVDIAGLRKTRVSECQARLIRAHIRRTIGADPRAVVDELGRATALAETTGAAVYEPFLREERSRLYGQEVELREALRLYRQIGATGHARRLEAELSARPVP